MFISQPPCGDACILDSSAAISCNSSIECGTPSRSSAAGSPGQQNKLATEHAQQLNTGQIDSNSQVPETGSCDSTTSKPCCASPEEVLSTTDASIEHTFQTSPCSTVSAPTVFTSHKLGSRLLLQPLPHASAVCSDKMMPQPVTVATTEQSMQPCEAPSDTQPGQQQPGILRRKPGRGDATLSMSCSDKLARWNILGVQVTWGNTYYIRDTSHNLSLF